MINKIKVLTLASAVIITLTSTAEKSNSFARDLCLQFGLGICAGYFIGTVPPLMHIQDGYKRIKKLSAHPDSGIFNTGMGPGLGLALYNWYHTGQVISKKFFNSSKGRYIAVLPALWLLSTNWKNNV